MFVCVCVCARARACVRVVYNLNNVIKPAFDQLALISHCGSERL